MYIYYSKYYIDFNNNNNSILQELNNLDTFYSYDNPIIKNINIYFHKKIQDKDKGIRNEKRR